MCKATGLIYKYLLFLLKGIEFDKIETEILEKSTVLNLIFYSTSTVFKSIHKNIFRTVRDSFSDKIPLSLETKIARTKKESKRIQ